MQESSTDEEVSSLVLQCTAGGRASLDSAQQQPLSPRDTQSDGGSSPFAEEMMASRWGAVEESCSFVASPHFSIESRVQMLQYIQKIEDDLEKLKVHCLSICSIGVFIFLSFCIRKEVGKKQPCLFFVFSSYIWKLLKQNLGDVLFALSCGLQEASSSARASGYVYCFDLNLERFPRDRTKLMQVCSSGVLKGPLA